MLSYVAYMDEGRGTSYSRNNTAGVINGMSNTDAVCVNLSSYSVLPIVDNMHVRCVYMYMYIVNRNHYSN
jgi:hypothetical protein